MNSSGDWRDSRRRFIQRAALLAVASWLPAVARAENTSKEVIVVGAGISGLAAATRLRSLGFQVTVVEGRDRVGGRIWTDRSLGIPVDMGASWIHGPQGNPITGFAKQASARTFVTDDDSISVYDEQGDELKWEPTLDIAERKFEQLEERIESWSEKRDEDLSIYATLSRISPQALEDLEMQWFLTSVIEFDAGGPLEELSSWYWEGDEKFPGKDVVLPDGYDAITNLLAKGLNIKTKQVVQEIHQDANRVTITTDGETLSADFAVITLPLGVLKKGRVRFSPDLAPAMKRAIERVGVGYVNKVALLFDSMFWDVDQYIGITTRTRGKYPYFLNLRKFSSANGLMNFGFGNFGKEMEGHSNEKIRTELTEILRTIYESDAAPPTRMLVSRWNRDPFAQGSYSFCAVGCKPSDFAQLGKPNRRLFFAGEHTSPRYWGTVHGAYLSGVRAADEVRSL